MNEVIHPRPGQRWAHFQVLAEIARGNMGVVYRARDTLSGRDVALKVLLGQRTDPDSVERFGRESKSLMRLSHPAIVKVADWGVHEGLPYLAMEFVPGTNLQELLDAGPLPLTRAVGLLAQVARAIDHAHSRGVVHRDLKPANVLVGPDGAPRITDFGLARLSDASTSLTQEGDLVGTPVFMSPEQIRGEIRALGPSTDVWALGVILYLLLTGQLPFRGTNVEEVSRRVVQDEPVLPRQLNPAVAEDLERICLAALRKDPRARYQSAGELGRDLDAFLRGRPVLAGRVTPAVRARRLARAASLHRGPLLIAAACLALGLGPVLGVHLHGRATRADQLATLRDTAEDEARAAGRLLEQARAELDRARPRGAREIARAAHARLHRAAALLDRAARLEQADPQLNPVTALEEPARGEEVQRGLEQRPALRQRDDEAAALEARVGAALPGGIQPGGSGELAELPGDVARGAEQRLESDFQARGDLADLDALAELAERRADLQPAWRARQLLDLAHPPGEAPPADPQLVELRGRLARLGALSTCPACVSPGEIAWRCAYCGHECRQEQTPCSSCGLAGALRQQSDAVGSAARVQEARRLLLAGAPHAARRALRESGAAPGDPLAHRLLRAALAREAGDPDECLAVLGPLLEAPEPPPEALLEAARARLDQGRPHAAQALTARLAAADAPWRVALAGATVTALARWLQEGRETLDPLAQLARDEQAPLLARLDACRLLMLADPALGSVPALPAAAPRTLLQLHAQVLAARASGRAAEALERLAWKRTFGRTERELPPLDPQLALAAGPDAAPWVRSVTALQRLARDELELARPLTKGLPALERLVSDGLAASGASDASPPPPGYGCGLAALIGLAAPDGEAHQQVGLALRALTMAVHAAPLDPWPRIQRARLHLRRAALGSTQLTRDAALTDAAAAALLAPDEPVAMGLLEQARWVSVGTRQAPPTSGSFDKLTAPFQLPRGERLEPGVAAALEHLPPRADAPWNLDWLDPDDPDEMAAWRLQRELGLAAGSRPPALPDPARLRALLEERMQHASGTELALLEAQRLLEDPATIDDVLLAGADREPQPRQQAVLVARLRELGQGRAAAAVARAIALWRQMESEPSPPIRDALRREAQRELAWAARRRPVPGLRALEMVVELGQVTPPRREVLQDLLVPAWPGALHELLRALTYGTSPPAGERARALAALPALRRLAATSSGPPRSP